MSAKAIWAAAPATIRQAPVSKAEPAIEEQEKGKEKEKKPMSRQPVSGVVPAGLRCKHNLEQPRIYQGTGHGGEALSSRKTTCYKCTFVCFKCSNDVTGICEDCF